MVHKQLAQSMVDHVIPTRNNGFIPHLLKENILWAVLGVGVALFGFSQFLHVTNYLNINAEVYPTTIVTLANQDRTALGMPALSVSQTLTEAAQLKAEDMVDNNYFAHTSPSGISPWHWFEKAGYRFMYAGENLAVNFTDSDTVEKAWLNSPAHRANILSGNFTQIGIALAKGSYDGNPTTFVVELFGMPAVAKSSPVMQPTLSAPAPTPSTAPTVAGESTTASPESQLRIVDDSQTFVSVRNTDPSLEQEISTQPKAPKVSWWTNTLLHMDTYIGTILEIIIVGLILAMATLAAREHEKHHQRHMVYGVLMTIILTSFLFIGRIGVFAEAASQPIVVSSQT